MLPQFAGLGHRPLSAPTVTESASAAASLAAVVAASALALHICQSQSTGPGGRTRTAAAAEAPTACSVSVLYSSPSSSVPATGPCVVARVGAAADAAVDKPSRSFASPAVASAVGRGVAGYRLRGPPFSRCCSRCHSRPRSPFRSRSPSRSRSISRLRPCSRSHSSRCSCCHLDPCPPCCTFTHYQL